MRKGFRVQSWHLLLELRAHWVLIEHIVLRSAEESSSTGGSSRFPSVSCPVGSALVALNSDGTAGCSSINRIVSAAIAANQAQNQRKLASGGKRREIWFGALTLAMLKCLPRGGVDSGRFLQRSGALVQFKQRSGLCVHCFIFYTGLPAISNASGFASMLLMWSSCVSNNFTGRYLLSPGHIWERGRGAIWYGGLGCL